MTLSFGFQSWKHLLGHQQNLVAAWEMPEDNAKAKEDLRKVLVICRLALSCDCPAEAFSAL